MVAIAIIAVLATVGMIVYGSAQKSGRISKRLQDLDALRTAIELYKTATGGYPNQNATATCANSLTALNAALVPNYMTAIPSDPLGGTNCYRYQSDAASNSQDYKVWTFVASTEMGDADFEKQPALIDPARDGGSSAGCTIEAGTASAWAYYTNSAAACAY